MNELLAIGVIVGLCLIDMIVMAVHVITQKLAYGDE